MSPGCLPGRDLPHTASREPPLGVLKGRLVLLDPPLNPAWVDIRFRAVVAVPGTDIVRQDEVAPVESGLLIGRLDPNRHAEVGPRVFRGPAADVPEEVQVAVEIEGHAPLLYPGRVDPSIAPAPALPALAPSKASMWPGPRRSNSTKLPRMSRP